MGKSLDAKIRTMNEPSICAQCGGSLEPKTITHQQPRGAELFEFENVPALVCRQCGEEWLTSKVTQTIDAIIEQNPKPKRYHQVPVFSFSEFTLESH